MRTTYKKKEEKIGTQNMTVTLEDLDQELIEVESNNPEQENLFGKSYVEEIGYVDGQVQADKLLSGEFK